jgi:ATP-dependent Clp protease ATP-binding subunit ClpC
MATPLTDYARNVLTIADQVALRKKHEYVGTDHILLGLLQQGRGVAVAILGRHEIDLDRVRHALEHVVPDGERAAIVEKRPHTPRVKNVIRFAEEEAEFLGNDYIGTEHILLGLLREPDSLGGQLLSNFGLKVDEVRKEVVDLLSGEAET